ncbi:phage major capsid protein [Clostridium sp.]|uniref:phage major capsid protein n=1 Tax=Clostridium sp. TaxID=1506 RepID=UPI002638A6DD|nr:phage major capsid protein [Clostridium sp.]
MIKNKLAEYRTLPTNEKGLEEQRTDLALELTRIIESVEGEQRAFTDEEIARVDEIKKEKEKIERTLAAIEEARSSNNIIKEKKNEEEKKGDLEERAFANYIRGVVETRSEANLSLASNGAVIPKTIAQKIIKKVYDISPIYQLATRYNVKGDLTIPYYDESSSAITTAYATEFTDLESSSGKFKNIELKGYLAGALTKVSKSLLNNSNFDLISFVITAMAESIARFIEKELLKGTPSKITGLSTVKQKVTAVSGAAVTADELIDVQEMIPDVYQAGAIWIMNKSTRSAIRKLKDNDGNYLLNRDVSSKWGYTLLGKDVYTSENMDVITSEKTSIYYGDMSGLAVKLSEDINIEVLREKYATQHAIGVVGWVELDSKIENEQKIAALVMGS